MLHFSTFHQNIHTAEELGHRFVRISLVPEGQTDYYVVNQLLLSIQAKVSNPTFCQGTFVKV